MISFANCIQCSVRCSNTMTEKSPTSKHSAVRRFCLYVCCAGNNRHAVIRNFMANSFVSCIFNTTFNCRFFEDNIITHFSASFIAVSILFYMYV